MLETLNTYQITGIIFVLQAVFIYFRTLNVYQIINKNRWGAVLSNTIISTCFFLSLALGIKSMFQGDILPVIAYIIGGCLGTYLGMLKK